MYVNGILCLTRRKRLHKMNTGVEFTEQILEDLIAQGYSGSDLLDRFKKVQKEVRPAVESMLVEAERVAALESGYEAYDDVFGTEKKGR